ncbi:MAG: FecR family protein [Alphaproteobacteria bacterium]|nr:FecR family protein [Alphaproteobacteria bacterium]
MNSLHAIARALLLGIFMLLVAVPAALADDWQAVKLRGGVFALVGEAWVQLARGDVVADERIIRTAPNGRVQFIRGNETIDLGPNTQIRIYDREGTQFTIVQQHFGDVSVDVERRNVQHFAIQTKYLAAIVKGTRFSVSADADGAVVKVGRGQVQVRDVVRHLMVDVSPNQSASAGSASILSVSGAGTHAPIVQFAGEPLAADVETIAVVQTIEEGSTSVVALSAAGVVASTPATTKTTVAADGTVITTLVVTSPAVANTATTPAASVVAGTPAATSTTVTTSTPTSTAVTTTVSSATGTPAVSNTADTPAASVVANTPAATNTPPSHSNAGGKNK